MRVGVEVLGKELPRTGVVVVVVGKAGGQLNTHESRPSLCQDVGIPINRSLSAPSVQDRCVMEGVY
jgi:hypothetical protein